METATAIYDNLPAKISRLLQERGWNQEDFARITGLNRQTIHQILQKNEQRRLRNATVAACAKALGLSVSELRDAPLERLLQRMNRPIPDPEDERRRQYELAMQPQLVRWMEQNPERAKQLLPEEMDELLSLQGTGGPLTQLGVEHFVHRIERKRQLIERVHAVAGTEYLDMLDKFVELLYEKIQPYRDRI